VALTRWRWLVAAAILCAISGTVVLRPRNPESRADRSAAIYEPERRIGFAMRLTASRIQAIRVSDSIAALVARGSIRGSQILMDRALPDRYVALAQALVSRAAETRPMIGRHPVVVAVVFDTVSRVNGVSPYRSGTIATEYVLPRGEAQPCIVIARIRSLEVRWWNRTTLMSDRTAQALLGPCGFYEWFGIPGPGISSWLANGGWDFGAVSAWQQEQPLWAPPQWYSASALYGQRVWGVREFMSLGAFRCVTGDADQCRRQLLRDYSSPSAPDAVTVLAPHLISAIELPTLGRWESRNALGPRGSLLLAEMARALGADRFQLFWSSPLPATEAFRAATDRDIGDWTSEWARTSYGEQARGPGIEPVAVLLGALAAGLAIAAAALMARRRQVA